jgi:RimJ/RimL family protein N-acetyltransferase
MTVKVAPAEIGEIGDRPPSANGVRPRTAARPASWLETMRLELRAFGPEDFDDFYRLDRDPQVMKYFTKGKPMPRDVVVKAFGRVLRYPSLYHDLGAWHASRRDTGAFIGWFCLKYAGRSADVEVGYRLLPEAWGRGLATEGAQALVDFGFDDLGLDRIIGVTHPGNKASQRVLIKAGLQDAGWARYYNQRMRLFVAENPDR